MPDSKSRVPLVRIGYREDQLRSIFVKSFSAVQATVHLIAVEHGWWQGNRHASHVECPRCHEQHEVSIDVPRSDGECIALMHSELSECLEGLRESKGQDKHCPDFDNDVIELADLIIRAMDWAERKDWPLAEAIEAKIRFNDTRPYKHGGKKF